MRGLNTALATEIAKGANEPIELYQIYFDEDTLYLAAYNADINFFNEAGTPTTYYGTGISRSPIRTNVDTRVDQCTVSLDNVSRELSALAAHTKFANRRLKIIKVFKGLLDSASNHIVIFDGIMDAPVITQEALGVTVTSRLDILGVYTPRRTYQRHCGWQFGSSECGVAATKVIGTVSAISGTSLTLGGRTEASNHFKDGVLTIGNESRRIISSSAGSITVEFAFDRAKVGNTYSLRRGCDKVYETCQNRFSNGARFGGFRSVLSDRD